MGAFSEQDLVNNPENLSETPAVLEGAAAQAADTQAAPPPAPTSISVVDDLFDSLDEPEAPPPPEPIPFPGTEGAAGGDATGDGDDGAETDAENTAAAPPAGDSPDGEEAVGESPDGDAAQAAADAESEEAKKKAELEKKKQEHEAAEAERKAKWESDQAARKEKEAAEWQKVLDMTDDEAASQSAVKVGTDSERLTRRNMKVCVTEHIQQKCLEDPAFARQTMHPRKNMINCFRYINRNAMEHLREEAKLERETTPGAVGMGGGYGGDVPDDLCYKWAEDYFYDMEAPEDGKEEEFKPKPFYGGYQRPAPKKKEKKPPKPKAPPKKKHDDNQMMLVGA